MKKEELLKHKFQFISFCPVYVGKDIRRESKGRFGVNDDYHLMHVTQGTASAFCSGQQFNLTRGTVLAVPPFVEFRLEVIDCPFEMLNIHCHVWLSNEDPLDMHAMLPLVFRPEHFEDIEVTLRKMAVIVLTQKGMPESLRLASLAHDVVLQHLGEIELIPRLSKAIDERIKRCHDHLLSSTCHRYNAKEAAIICSLSVSQMNRLFRRCFKLSPQQFWEKHRFTCICLELKNASKTISQVASDHGFADIAYFSRWFKKMGKCSPSSYRRKEGDLTSLL